MNIETCRITLVNVGCPMRESWFDGVRLALSLAASGGYVNIIRLLLNAGAEINSRFVDVTAVKRIHVLFSLP